MQARNDVVVISMTEDGGFTGSWYKQGSMPDYDYHIQFYNEGDQDHATNSPRDLKLGALAMDHSGW